MVDFFLFCMNLTRPSPSEEKETGRRIDREEPVETPPNLMIEYSSLFIWIVCECVFVVAYMRNAWLLRTFH